MVYEYCIEYEIWSIELLEKRTNNVYQMCLKSGHTGIQN